MHLLNALDVEDNSDRKWFHNVIVNILEVVLKDDPVLPRYQLSQLEPKLFLKVDEFIYS